MPTSKKKVDISTYQIPFIPPWILKGDPVPDWIISDKTKFAQFMKVELELRKKVHEIEIDRIRELQKMM